MCCHIHVEVECPYLGNKHYDPNMVINNGIFPENVFRIIKNVHFGIDLMFLLAITK